MRITTAEEPLVEQMAGWLEGSVGELQTRPMSIRSHNAKTGFCSDNVSAITHPQQTQVPTVCRQSTKYLNWRRRDIFRLLRVDIPRGSQDLNDQSQDLAECDVWREEGITVATARDQPLSRGQLRKEPCSGDVLEEAPQLCGTTPGRETVGTMIRGDVQRR